MSAHNDGDEQLGDTAFQAISSLAIPNEPDTRRLEFMMIYHSGFGDLDTAASLARQLIVLGCSLPPASAARLQLNASRALWMAGFAEESLATLVKAHENCVVADLIRLRLMVLSRLTTYNLDRDGESSGDAWKWLGRARELEAKYPWSFAVSDYATLRIQLALASQDIDEARRCHTRFDTMAGADKNHVDRWIRALIARLDHQANRGISEARLQDLINSAMRPRRNEVSDYELAVALSVLIGSRRRVEARCVLDHYVAHRRMRSPLTFDLAECVRELSSMAKLDTPSPSAARM
jgi:hypothetical protein